MHEQVFDARSMIVLGTVLAVHDDGQAQTVDVQTHSGILRSSVEVFQIFGAASRPPLQGAIALLFAVGGDVGHYVALPLGNPSVRFGNLQEGDGGVIYAPDGTRVAAMVDGVLQIVGMAQVEILSPDVTITAPNGVTITGPVNITGDTAITGKLSATGDGSIGGNLNVTGNIVGQHVSSRS